MFRSSRRLFGASRLINRSVHGSNRGYIAPTSNRRYQQQDNDRKYQSIGISTLLGVTAAIILSSETINAKESSTDDSKAQETIDWTNLNTMNAPEKLFKEFASITSTEGNEGEPLMTPSDFLRVITPGIVSSIENVSADSLEALLKLIDCDGDGLINYSEFIMFTTLLSIPPKYTKIAFKLFDTDNSNSIDQKEFREMISLIEQSNPLARGSAPYVKYGAFFGVDGRGEMTFAEFDRFVRCFRKIVATIQFEMIAEGKESISAEQYGRSLVMYGGNEQNSRNIAALKENPVRITCEEYLGFLGVLQSMDEIDFILRSFMATGEPFDKNQLKRIVKAVSGTVLSDSVLDVVFFVFDNDGDGLLDYDEFMAIMKKQQQLGFSHKPNDSPLIRAGKCIQYCWKQEISSRHAKSVK